MPEIYEIATGFRVAIEEAVRSGEIKEMGTFPRGCCSYASDLLQRYLIEQYGFFTWYMSGEYGHGCDAESHAWLETQDGMVIDITGDQYKYKNLRFTEPVYVGTRNNGFHDKFQLHKPLAYSFVDDPFGQNKADCRYEAVMKHIRKEQSIK